VTQWHSVSSSVGMARKEKENVDREYRMKTKELSRSGREELWDRDKGEEGVERDKREMGKIGGDAGEV